MHEFKTIQDGAVFAHVISSRILIRTNLKTRVVSTHKDGEKIDYFVMDETYTVTEYFQVINNAIQAAKELNQ